MFRALGLDPGALRRPTRPARGWCILRGGDLKERDGMSDPDRQRRQHVVSSRPSMVMDCPILVIAAVNGAALRGGAELVLACDFRACHCFGAVH
ncbi:MAG: hypothetical protein H6898_16520 [Rhodobacter sp.]|nr:hypothetical protein [Rhodobacter sp.]